MHKISVSIAILIWYFRKQSEQTLLRINYTSYIEVQLSLNTFIDREQKAEGGDKVPNYLNGTGLGH